jgi:hypothetical protein
MIWKELGEFEFHSGTDGSAREYSLPVQDWGRQGREIVYCIEIVGRKSTTAMIGMKHYHAPRNDLSLRTLHSTPITVAAVTADLPTLFLGVSTATSIPLLPWFWPTVVADTTLASEEFLVARVYAGTSPF